MDGSELGYRKVVARTRDQGNSKLFDLTDWNTDKFDVTGGNVRIYECAALNQDDHIALQDRSKNILLETINERELGITVGSVSCRTTDNHLSVHPYAPSRRRNFTKSHGFGKTISTIFQSGGF